MRRDLHEENRQSWNEATVAHNSHKNDQATFFRHGGHTLYPEELRLLGTVKGKTLAHLLCNSGQDTLSLAQLGATTTGVDISDQAISFARQLSKDSGLRATFIRADVYDWLHEVGVHGHQFDVVFSSYGALCWLSDLQLWARGIQSALRPGGILVLVEFHPIMQMLSASGGYQVQYPYGGGALVSSAEGVDDYVAGSGLGLTPNGYLEGVVDFKNSYPSHEFQWGIADFLGAMLDAGWALESFEEYPYCNGFKPYADMVQQPGRRFTTPGDIPAIPLMFGTRWRKP